MNTKIKGVPKVAVILIRPYNVYAYGGGREISGIEQSNILERSSETMHSQSICFKPM